MHHTNSLFLTGFCLLLCVGHAGAQNVTRAAHDQPDPPVTVQTSQTLGNALVQSERRPGGSFTYSSELLDGRTVSPQPRAKISAHVQPLPTSSPAASPRGTVAVAPQLQVSGVVTDGTGEALPGVNVLLKGTSNGTITDINGRYSLEIPDAAADGGVLVFS
ncbi:MAG: carboxypeptidase-like regulatory domain-containing protein [Catalinimonas sp.]